MSNDSEPPVPADLSAFPHWQKLVDSRPAYRRLWLKGLFPPPESFSQLPRTIKRDGQIELPKDVVSMGKRYLQERSLWKELGKPIRDTETIKHIFTNICQSCEHFDKKNEKLGRCKICMCYLKPKDISFNKIAWATTSCPANPPKWKTDIIQVNDENKKQEQQLWQEQVEKQTHGLKMRDVIVNNKPAPAPPRKKCCGG